MIEKDAIKELSKAQAITAASSALPDDVAGYAALPDDFQLHDLEKSLPIRRRARGAMTTSLVADFASYAKANSETGAAVFVDVDQMRAVAVLNLGTPDAPGHADNTATLTPRPTAAYKSLKQTANGTPKQQKDVAEWIEDWADCIKCFVDDAETPTKKAVAAIRKITIEALKKVEATEQQLSATRSAFESVTASSTESLPTRIDFTTRPYGDFAPRTFSLRLSVLTSDKPALTLRIAAQEQHEEDMAQELAAKAAEALDGDMPVVLGTYKAS